MTKRVVPVDGFYPHHLDPLTALERRLAAMKAEFTYGAITAPGGKSPRVLRRLSALADLAGNLPVGTFRLASDDTPGRKLNPPSLVRWDGERPVIQQDEIFYTLDDDGLAVVVENGTVERYRLGRRVESAPDALS